jgi:hypothetical protein
MKELLIKWNRYYISKSSLYINTVLMLKSQKPNWSKRLVISLVLLTVFGIVPWEDIFSLEYRNQILITLAGGALSFGAITMLLCVYFINVMSGHSKQKGIIATLLIIGIIVSGGLLVISTVFNPDLGQDIAVYQNHDKYRVLQFNAFGLRGERTEWRLIKTLEPYSAIRRIDILKISDIRQKFNLPEFGNEYIHPRKSIIIGGKIWYLQPSEE